MLDYVWGLTETLPTNSTHTLTGLNGNRTSTPLLFLGYLNKEDRGSSQQVRGSSTRLPSEPLGLNEGLRWRGIGI